MVAESPPDIADVPEHIARGAAGARLLLLENDLAARRIVADLADVERDDDLQGVRCPLCAWRPTAASRWCCWWSEGPEAYFVSCGAEWNTFTTRGRCPGCQHQWQWTSCLRCGEWSPHEDWYEEAEA
jgi:DNA-directed RNA polymerase subunit RPC12/RpoP